jgi:hypothetical protein
MHTTFLHTYNIYIQLTKAFEANTHIEKNEIIKRENMKILL